MSIERRGQRGVSLIEVVMFILVVGIALAAVVNVFIVANRGSADPALRRQAMAIAQSFLDEIRNKAFANPTGGYASSPCNEAERSQFDDALDYDGYDQTGIADLGNAALAGLESYRVRVAVAPAALGTVASTGSLRIAVTVTDPAGVDTVLESYRTDY